MKLLKKLSILSISLIVLIGWGSLAQAQSGHYSAASLGMGGTGTAYLDTYHANFVNPANLLINSGIKPSTSFGLLGGISARAGGPLLNISVYNQHFTSGQTIGNDAIDAWFGTDPSESKRMGFELDIIPIGLSVRGDNIGFSLALRNRTLYSGAVNRGYAEVLLAGISQERFGNPTPVNFSSEAVNFSELSAGFSFKLLELPSLPGIGKNVKFFAGVAPKYIVPQYTSGIDFNSTLQVTDNQVIHDFEYTFRTVGNLTDQFKEYHQASQDDNFDGSLGDFVEPDGSSFTEVQGSGFGIDLGGTVEMDLAGPLAGAFSWINGPKKLRVGVSVTDIGSFTYDNNAGRFSNSDTFTWDGIDFEDGFGDAFADSVVKEIYLNYQPGDGTEITKELPTKLQLGSQLKLGKLAFALDFIKGLNETGMNTKRLALGFGAEYKLFNFIPLRAGYQTGGLASSRLTFGTGLDFKNFELTVAGVTVPNSENRGSSIGGAWSGLMFRF